MPRLLLLCILALVLSPVALLAQNCTEDDYKASYTECTSSNTRDLVYYKKQDSNCTGGIPVSPPVYNLPCGIACKPGSHLPLGQTQCAACLPGTFSIGGGYKIDSWYSWPEDVSFKRYSYTQTNRTHVTTGPQWTLESTYVRSGNITHSTTVVLELTVYIASTIGHVAFEYRVNAEYLPPFNYDGIQFDVDGVVQLPKTSHTSNYVSASYPLGFGAHVLSWSYIKDFSDSKGEDAAFIRLIEIGGITYADDFCTECPEGTYNPNNNATTCLSCPPNTFSNSTGASSCTPCAATEYSYSEAASCSPRLPCTAQDYESFYTACNGGTRTLVSSWITPTICDPDSRLGVQLPQPQTGLPCGDCTDGAYRNPVTSVCDYCPDGRYSNNITNGACNSCPAGTAAIKIFAVTQFDDWVAGSTTNCSGDCSNQGWLLHSSYMNSGIGHGSTVSSWFQFNVTLVAPGTLTFNYSIACPSAQCSLSLAVSSGATTVYPAPQDLRTSDPIRLDTGTHSLNWTFSKYDYGTSRDDAANIYSIMISSTTIGGAVGCTKCAAGSYSAAGASQCSPCPVGQQSNEAGTACVGCPAGTFNSRVGGVCVPCGHGTTAFANATGCDVTCTYSPEGSSTLYDLNGLRNSTVSYGPVADKQKQSYYINICGTQPHMCYAAKDTPIDSYACQETIGKIVGTDVPEGKDIGRVLGWSPLPANNSYKTNLGVIMSLDYGDPGCAAAYGDVPRNRETKIIFLCDPSAGIGAPAMNGSAIETSPCQYSFLWRSLYACPVCDINVDMAFYYSPCQDGRRTKTYYWLKNPPTCHGRDLPGPSVVNCSESQTVCPAGQYLEEGLHCTGCKAGSYSVGGGERIMTWARGSGGLLPSRFSSSCMAAGSCTLWNGGEDGVETISTGNGDSALSAVFDFVVAGSISFYYKLYSPNAGKFAFTVDAKDQLNITVGSNRLGWTYVSIPVSKGVHAFVWTFVGGSEANATTPRVGAVLKEVTIVGTDYHDDACTPCPAGFKSAANASACTACGLDHFSSAPDSDTCTPCSASTTALHKATVCVPRPACTESDYVALYTACSTNNTRTQYFTYLQPQFCASSKPLPQNQTVPCAPCLPGSFPDPNSAGECTVCPPGEFYASGKCTAVPAGSVAVKKKYYFADNSTDSLPAGFSTSCSGDCGSTGWRVLGGAVDSGYHADHAVDSWLKLQTTIIWGFGSIAFDYSLAPGTAGSVDFYIDGKFIASLFGNGQYSASMEEGDHTITWNYHQSQSATGYVTLSNIIVDGVVDSDAGSFIEKCPAGTFSAQGAASCTPCPPGSYGKNESAELCTPCPPLSYNSDYGATECLLCDADSYSAAGSQFCINEKCQYTTTIDGKALLFSLADTNTIGPLPALDSSFYLNLCNASLDAPCNPSKPSHACAVENESPRRDWGGYLTFNASQTAIKSGSGNTSYALSFSHGDNSGCAEDIMRSTVVKFQCDVSTTGALSFVSSSSDQCTAVFAWSGRAGCPVCQDQDYTTLLGPCVDGMRTVQKMRSSDCNGVDVIAAPSQSCAGTVEFPIAVVFVVIGVVLVLVAAAVVVFIKNRRISAQYSRLKHQADHANAFSLDDTTL